MLAKPGGDKDTALPAFGEYLRMSTRQAFWRTVYGPGAKVTHWADLPTWPPPAA